MSDNSTTWIIGGAAAVAAFFLIRAHAQQVAKSQDITPGRKIFTPPTPPKDEIVLDWKLGIPKLARPPPMYYRV
jgi:hypothetical protein